MGNCAAIAKQGYGDDHICSTYDIREVEAQLQTLVCHHLIEPGTKFEL